MVKRFRSQHSGWALFKGLAFASPFLIGFVLLYSWPILASGYYSLTDFSLFKAPRFVGLANYERMLNDDKFWKSLYNTLYFTFVGVPVDIAISLAGAHILNMKLRGQALWRALIYLPSIVPVVAAGFLWRWLLNAQYGFVNEIARWFGLPQPNWLLDSAWGGISVLILMLWTVGGTMLIYLAALKDVPVDLYEAAELDGASHWRRFVDITWPMVSPVTLFQIIVLLIAFLQVFTQPFVLSKDPGLTAQSAIGPGDSMLTYSIYLFQNAFMFLKMGYASAMAWVLLFVTLGITLLVLWSARKWVFYGNR
ncbi:MAG: sugar ABC transporter permease [Proteobacteria bacterium]|nr:MAG: sugar ABC transporter permease [Pseudomonadota bacterium]